MRTYPFFSLFLPAVVSFLASFLPPSLNAQIPGSEVPGAATYRAEGTSGQPFSVEVLGVRRTLSNSLLVRVALTNNGASPLAVKYDFSGNTNPAEAGKISAIYIIDPSGQKKYGVLSDAQGQTLCSRLDTPLQPHERRELFAQMASPPDTISAVDVFFPRATRILKVPVGLPGAGEPLPPGATIGNPGASPAPAAPVGIAPTSASNQPTSNALPDVYATVPGGLAANTSAKAIGNIQSGTSTTPFIVEALGVRRSTTPGGNTVLRLALTNNGSNVLDATGQFTTGLTDLGSAHAISGVYMIDMHTGTRYAVVREGQSKTLCSNIDQPLNTGERRTLEAQFPPLPSTTKAVGVYFPHAGPITSVIVE